MSQPMLKADADGGSALRIWIAVVAVIAAAVLGVSCAFPIARAVFPYFTSHARPTPVTFTLAAQAGRYAVFERIGATSGYGAVSVTRTHAPTVTPDLVRVTGPDGAPIEVGGIGWFNETIDRNGAVFVATAAFTIPRGGQYVVAIKAAGGDVIVVRSIGETLRGVIGWTVGEVVALALLVVGIVFGVKGLARRRRARRTSQPSNESIRN